MLCRWSSRQNIGVGHHHSGIAIVQTWELLAMKGQVYEHRDVRLETDLTVVFVLWEACRHSEGLFACNAHMALQAYLVGTRTIKGVS